MANKKIKVVIVSKDSSFRMKGEEFAKYASLADMNISYVDNNTKSLAEVYNTYLAQDRANYDFMMFMHADVWFDLGATIPKIITAGDKYDVIGFCGTEVVNVSQSPLNWWTGSNPTPQNKWGSVIHGELGDKQSLFNQHTPDATDHEVACIDGLCIIFNKKALESGIAFDPLFTFDFYDTDISFQAMINYRLKLGVIIERSLHHFSVGKSILNKDFLMHEIDFRSKWKLEVPPNSPIRQIPKGDIIAHCTRTGSQIKFA